MPHQQAAAQQNAFRQAARNMARWYAIIPFVVAAPAWAQTASRNAPPPLPYVVRGICPGEGCSFGEWIACARFVARAAESATAPVVFRLERSAHFQALTGDLLVVRAGLMVFRDTVRVTDDEILGTRSLVFTPADTLYPLFYGSEGSGSWYFHGRTEAGPWFVPDWHTDYHSRPGAVLVRRAVAHWWIRVRNTAGGEGWIDLGSPDYPPFHATILGMSPHYEDSPPRCPTGR